MTDMQPHPNDTPAQTPAEGIEKKGAANLNKIESYKNDDSESATKSPCEAELSNDDPKNTESEELEIDPKLLDQADFLAQYEKLMADGEELFKQSKYHDASDSFSRALELSTRRYGELDPNCGDAYLHYGEAMLFCEKEEAQAQMIGAVSKRLSNESNETEDLTDMTLDEYMEISWECLEMARVIFERSDNKSQLAQAYFLLAEHNLEAEHFDEAANYFMNSLECRPKNQVLMIAKTHLQIGFVKLNIEPPNPSDALLRFNDAKSELKRWVSNESEAKEKEELEKEVDIRIEEAKLYKRKAKDVPTQRLNEFGSSTISEPLLQVNNLGTFKSKMPVNNLNTMGIVKRKPIDEGNKRKTEEETESNKKVKIDV